MTPQAFRTIPGIVDGAFLPRHPQELLTPADFQPVTSITGVNNDEFDWFLSTVRSSPMSSSLGSPGRMAGIWNIQSLLKISPWLPRE